MKLLMHFFALSVALGLLMTVSWATQREVSTSEQEDRLVKAPMDFVHFKSTFSRHYGSFVEEASRQRLFLARFLKACVSQVKYRLGFETAYSGINHFSDRTREERERLAMRLSEHPELLNSTNATGLVLDSPKKGISALKNLYDYFNKNEPTPMDVTKRPIVGGNDDYKHIKIVYDDGTELSSIGHSASLESKRYNNNINKPLKDRVFHDLRQSGCFNTVRDQGDCGACYVFTNLVLMEYLYCMSNKKLAKFSEQFVVDCGKPFKLDGCNGGTFDGVTELIQQLGLEMDAWYPYQQRETQCPFVKGNQLIKRSFAGYIRPRIELRKSNVPIHLWETCLAAGIPLDVSITTDIDSFTDYAGGVDKGGRADDQYHSMTLIGSGRERGVDYWLLRNSFGSDWGIGGHYKLAKDSFILKSYERAETYSVFLESSKYTDIFEFNKHYKPELVADKRRQSK